MKRIRKLGLTLAAAAVAIGLLGATAPAAEADTSWGGRGGPISTP